MPHVVIEGARPLAELVAGFGPLRVRLASGYVKCDLAFIERQGQIAHFPVLTVAGEHRQTFQLLATERERSISVRFDPLTDPERTPVALAALALLATWIERASDGSRVGATNVAPALDEARAGFAG